MAEPIVLPKSPKFQDLTGQVFFRLTVKSYAGKVRSGTAWNCLCACGSHVVAVGSAMKSGNTKSCGCLHREVAALRATARNYRHGHYKANDLLHFEYRTWNAMISRCYNVRYRQYKDYGGRGIKVCERWLESFENFYADMGPKPSPKHSLDRIDNDGDYCAENCRWATRIQQVRNSRHNHLISFGGETLCLSEWADRIGVHTSSLWSRLKSGWTIERTLTTPKLH